MPTLDHRLQLDRAVDSDVDGDELDDNQGEVRWLAPDARPAMTAVLDVLEGGGSKTPDEIAGATGFTERTIARILRELTIAGTLSKSSSLRHGLRYRRRRPAGD